MINQVHFEGYLRRAWETRERRTVRGGSEIKLAVPCAWRTTARAKTGRARSAPTTSAWWTGIRAGWISLASIPS